MSDNIIWAFPLLFWATVAWCVGGAVGGAAFIKAYNVADGISFLYVCILGAIPGIFWLFALGWMATGKWNAYWLAIRGKNLDGGDL